MMWSRGSDILAGTCVGHWSYSVCAALCLCHKHLRWNDPLKGTLVLVLLWGHCDWVIWRGTNGELWLAHMETVDEVYFGIGWLAQ